MAAYQPRYCHRTVAFEAESRFLQPDFCSPHTEHGLGCERKSVWPSSGLGTRVLVGEGVAQAVVAGLAAPTIAHGEARGGRGEERRPPGAGWRPSRWQYGAGAFATQHTLASEGCPQREEWSADSPTQLTGEARAAGVPPGTNAMEVEWVGGWSELRRGPASCLALCGSGAQRQPRRARGDKGS